MFRAPLRKKSESASRQSNVEQIVQRQEILDDARHRAPLRRFEERSAAAGEPYFHSHPIRFITTEGAVARTLQMGYGKPGVGTHLLPDETPSAAQAQHE